MVRRFKDLEELSRAAAEEFSRLASEAIQDRDRFTVALAGGSTPRRLYEILSAPPYRDSVAWERVEFFFGDERAVPPDQPDSNFRMASETMLRKLAIPSARVHRVRGEAGDLDRAAREYEQEIAHSFGIDSGSSPPAFDLILLGLGADGHTASLFPLSEGLVDEDRWVVPSHASTPPWARVTFTAGLINSARVVLFLVVGAEKAAALASVLEGPRDPSRLPAQLVRPRTGRCSWFVDHAAASQLACSTLEMRKP